MNTEQRNENPLTKRFTAWSLLRFTLPTISMMVFIGLYQVADAMFVSNYVNTDGLSATNVLIAFGAEVQSHF